MLMLGETLMQRESRMARERFAAFQRQAEKDGGHYSNPLDLAVVPI